MQAAHQLAAGLGLGATAQLWHAGRCPSLLQCWLVVWWVPSLRVSADLFVVEVGATRLLVANITCCQLPTFRLPPLSSAAVVLLDRCAAAGYKPALDAALAAACVALAAAREGIPADVAQLSAQLNREVCVLCVYVCVVGRLSCLACGGCMNGLAAARCCHPPPCPVRLTPPHPLPTHPLRIPTPPPSTDDAARDGRGARGSAAGRDGGGRCGAAGRHRLHFR